MVTAIKNIDLKLPALREEVCVICGSDLFVQADKEPNVSVCYSCNEKAYKRKKRVTEWQSICPSLYLDTDVARIKTENSIPDDKWDAFRLWQYNPKGIILHGATGKGKTRLMYKLLEHHFLEGRSVLAKFTNEFSVECQDAFTNGYAKDWMNEFYRADILFFDDFGNQRFTDRMEDSLFAIIEYRSSHKKPIMITTNYTGETLKDKISGDRAEALIRRLREFSTTINL